MSRLRPDGRSSPKAIRLTMRVTLLLVVLVALFGPTSVARDEVRTPSVADRPALKTDGQATALAPKQMLPPEAVVTLGDPWQEMGPGFITTNTSSNIENVPGNNPATGAVHSLAPHPTDADILYAGSVNGGIFKTTNATAGSPSWTALTDDFEAMAIGDIEFDPTDPGWLTLVAGTGRFTNFGRRGTTPMGILRTTDGGNSWKNLGQATFAAVDIWAVAPRGSNILAATGGGVFRSTDQGVTWTNISGLNGLNNGAVYDLANDPGDPQRIYAAVGGASGGVFRTDDAGDNWTDVTDGAIAAVVGGTTNNFRIAVSADTNNPVFIGIVNNSRLAAVFRSPDQGATWTAMDLPQTPEGPGSTPYGIHPGGQGVTNFSIAADPNDGDIVYVGGDRQPGPGDAGGVGFPNSIGANRYSGRLFRGDASVAPTGGVPSPQWTPLTHSGTASNSAPHPDSRDMDIDAGGELVQCDDGGVYRRSSPTTSGGDWFAVSLGGLHTIEYHDVAYDDNFDVIMGGTQDNGTAYQTAQYTDTWVARLGGDGGDVAIDHLTPGQSTFYFTTQNFGNFSRQTCTGVNVCGGITTITPVVTGNPIGTQFVTPIEVNSQDGQRLIIGGSNSVYESFDQGNNLAEITGPGANRNAMVYGHPDNADLIVVGTGTQVAVRTTAGGNLTTTAGSPILPAGGGNIFVTDVAVDPGDANTMFATTYSTGSDLATISITRDGGATWDDITGNLAELSQGNFRTVLYVEGANNDILCVGGAGGVFASVEPFDGCWSVLGEDLPKALVYDLDYDRADDRLIAGTLGRGVWTLDGVASLDAPFELTYPNGGETFLAGCQIEVLWDVGEGYEDETLNIRFSEDGGVTWTTLLTNTINDGDDVVTLPCVATSQGRIMLEAEGKTFCDVSNEDFAVEFPSITVTGTVDNTFDPPDPWAQDGLVIDTIEITADVDLFNVQFYADALQCDDVPCEPGDVKRIASDLIEFVPDVVGFLEEGQSMEIEVKFTVPIGQHACDYMGQIHVVADHECSACPEIVADHDVALEVLPQTDVDVDDNEGSLAENVLHLKGAKLDVVTGTFNVINPNSTVLNVDPDDGPGNIRIDPVSVTVSDLVKVGDPAVVIPSSAIMYNPLQSLASGEAQSVGFSVTIPDGIPVDAYYVGTVEVEYESCEGGDNVTDSFGVEVEVRETQGPLDILGPGFSLDFCPDDPWITVGQVEFEFDIHANGDHRNVRVFCGGLEHVSRDTKLDDFNFFPQEFALISAGETKTARVIVKVPIGQHAGDYVGWVKVVSENGGEDSTMVALEICPIIDLDIKDDYANLGDNVMVINALARSNASGGEWTVKAFDIGLPSNLTNNHDEFDGPSNTPIDCITWEFAEWSKAWHAVPENYHTNFDFTGVGSVDGELCTWESGTFKRMLVSVFVPPMRGNDNHPGTYRGRLDCTAWVGSNAVASDAFDIEVQLSRVVGPGGGSGSTKDTFSGNPTPGGALLSWGDFSGLGITGKVNLYREQGGEYVLFKSQLPQKSSYLDTDVRDGNIRSYKLGLTLNGKEILVGPLSVGSVPKFVGLAQNYPNPFNHSTEIRYNLPSNGQVSLKIYDVAGRLVRTLKDGEEIAGYRTVGWDGRTESGARAASGVYYCRLVTPDGTLTRKMVIVR